MLKRPITVLLSVYIAGICTAFHTQSRYLLLLSVFFSFLFFIILIFNSLKKRSCFYSPFFLFYFLGILSIYPLISFSERSDNILRYVAEGKADIKGCVDELVIRDRRHVAVLKNVCVGGRETEGRLRVSIGGITDIKKGYIIFFTSEIRDIRNYSNPGGFNYKRFLNFQNIYARTYVNGKKIIILKKMEKGLLDNLRKKISKLIDKSSGDHESKAVLKTIITGEKNISNELRQFFNRTGTGHILAVSGLHMGIIASFVYFISKFFLSYFKPVLIRGNLNRISALFTVPAVLVYGVLCGMSPSTQRAIIMVLIFVLSLQLKREKDLFNIICATGLAILIFDPRSLFSISFQLSFTAVLFIMLSLKLKIHEKTTNSIFGKLLSFAIVTFFATIGTMPIVAHYFQQISIVGLFINMLMVPVFSFVILPLGLISAFTGLISYSSGLILTGINLKILGIIVDFLKTTASMDFSAIMTVKPDLLETILIYLIIITSFMVLTCTNKRRYLILFILAVTFFIFDCSYWVYERYFRQEMRITFLDVGQGSSALVELPYGKTLLIDGGGFSNNRFFDMGKYVLAPFLLSGKILTIDTIILSHPNSDHMNGLIYIAENFNVKRLWSNTEASDTMSYRYLMKALDNNGIKHEASFRLKKEVFENAVLEVLYPVADFKKRKGSDSNANSLILKIVFGEFSVLFPGDIEEKSEKELVSFNSLNLKSTILLVPHHGSGTSSSIPFLRAVTPKFSVISSGYRNRFGFPDKNIVERLEGIGTRIFRIDKMGAVIFDVAKDDFKYRFYNNN